jgi:hypothetical protein
MVIVLAAYDVLLMVAIVLLEWHYIVDVFAGILVAAVAIAMVDGHAVRAAYKGARMNSDDPKRELPPAL